MWALVTTCQETQAQRQATFMKAANVLETSHLTLCKEAARQLEMHKGLCREKAALDDLTIDSD